MPQNMFHSEKNYDVEKQIKNKEKISPPQAIAHFQGKTFISRPSRVSAVVVRANCQKGKINRKVECLKTFSFFPIIEAIAFLQFPAIFVIIKNGRLQKDANLDNSFLIAIWWRQGRPF